MRATSPLRTVRSRDPQTHPPTLQRPALRIILMQVENSAVLSPTKPSLHTTMRLGEAKHSARGGLVGDVLVKGTFRFLGVKQVQCETHLGRFLRSWIESNLNSSPCSFHCTTWEIPVTFRQGQHVKCMQIAAAIPIPFSRASSEATIHGWSGQLRDERTLTDASSNDALAYVPSLEPVEEQRVSPSHIGDFGHTCLSAYRPSRSVSLAREVMLQKLWRLGNSVFASPFGNISQSRVEASPRRRSAPRDTVLLSMP
jgi:hypothetical protein